MIKAKNLFFKYGENWVLEGINLEIKEGSFIAIIGANGSGKTTLAKHFNSLLVPTKGSVLIDGIGTEKNDHNARKKVGFVFQNFEDQIVYSVVEEDIAFGLENLGLSNEEISGRVREILAELSIEHLAKRNVNTLSLGQKQLVALAGVLAMKPKYIVFDEPTTMLDSRNKRSILGIINGLNKKNKMTVILVTNVLDDVKYADKVIVMKKGRIFFHGKKQSLNKKTLKVALLDD